MKTSLIVAAVTAALSSVAYVPAASAQSASELAQLKAQIEALQAKVAEMEKAQKAQTETQDKTLDMIAQQRANVGDWVGRFTWKGDLRYRNEDIKQELVARERNRDRIRVRAGFVAKVNDTVTSEVQLTSSEPLSNGGNGDARSSNQTLTDANSRKRVFIDTAFFQWAPTSSFKATLGKMRYPFVRPTGSLFFDNDINPEGIAVNWQQGTGATPLGLFASAFYYQLFERSAGPDSTMAGAQIGWRADLGGSNRLTLAASYFDNGAVEGYNAVQDGAISSTLNNSFGNTTTALATVCRPGIINTTTTTSCIANDFNIVEAMAELSMQVGGQPLVFSLDYAKNNRADFVASATSPKNLDTAYMGGIQYGRVTGAHSWEVGYLYQKLENDALYAQWIDSDFAGGVTGSKGHVFKVGYGFGRNFRINGTYFLNDTNIDFPFVVGSQSVNDRKYRRLQIDLNVGF